MADPFSMTRLLHRMRWAVSERKRESEQHYGLEIISSPADAEVDIVAIHGLGGEGFKSWTTTEQGPRARTRPWLKELLAKDVANARILTFGYLSDANYRFIVRNVLYGRALDLVKDLSAMRKRDGTTQRPILFMAHSLGGLIVKRALIISSEAGDPVLRDIELSTCGVVFFGTPTSGMGSPASLARVIRRTSSLSSSHQEGQSRSPSPQPLDSDVEWLESQMEAFKAIMQDLPMLSFYETRRSQRGFIVDKRHSLGTDKMRIGLNATHANLVKFSGRTDQNYTIFIESFKKSFGTQQALDLAKAKWKSYDESKAPHLEYLKSNFSIPYRLPSDQCPIVSRQDLLDQLTSILQLPRSSESLDFRIASLNGPPGIGKTTLARHYVELNRQNLSFVFWIAAESWETVVGSYVELASSLVDHYSANTERSRVEGDLGLRGVGNMLKAKNIRELDPLEVKSVVKAVKNWLLCKENDKWLLVFDNVEPSYDVFDFIPLTLSGQVILTARDSSCCSWGTKVHVGGMKTEEAVELMGRSVGDDLKDEAQVAAARQIVDRLEGLPHAVSLAASTIRQRGLSFTEYQRLLNSSSPPRIVGSAIDQSPATRSLLRISAMLSDSKIPVDLFSAVPDRVVPPRFANALNETKTLLDLGHLQDALATLMDQNFIQSDSPTDSTSSSSSFDSFVLDPAAREFVRDSLTPEEREENAWLTCNLCVGSVRKKELDSNTLPEVHEYGRLIAPHAKVCYDDWSSVLEATPEEDNVEWHVLGNVCMTQGAIDQAIGCFHLALKHESSMTPSERIRTSLSLASLLQLNGQPEKCREILRAIDVGSIDRELAFRVALARASAAAANGELTDAQSQYNTVEHTQEELLGATNIMTVGTAQKLATTLKDLNKLEEAEALYRRVFFSYRSLFGSTHPMTLEALEELAETSQANGAIKEAESLYRQSIDTKTRTFGPGHPSTADSISKLAIIHDLRGEFDIAKEKYQAALDIMAPTLGKAHPLYLATLENMALSARLRGQGLTVGSEEHDRAFAEAEADYKEVIRIKKSAPDLYSEAHVISTVSKLHEMYENEPHFRKERDNRLSASLCLLRQRTKSATV